jgi:anti-anti-sigma regulatory factor
MAMNAVWLKIDELRAVQALQEAGDRLDRADGEVVMDFSAVRRIDSNLLQAMEEFANQADDNSVKVALHGVNVDVYKVLKLVKLAQRFTFAN